MFQVLKPALHIHKQFIFVINLTLSTITSNKTKVSHLLLCSCDDPLQEASAGRSLFKMSRKQHFEELCHKVWDVKSHDNSTIK